MRYELVVGELVLLFWSLDADVSFTIEAHTRTQSSFGLTLICITAPLMM